MIIINNNITINCINLLKCPHAIKTAGLFYDKYGIMNREVLDEQKLWNNN